jgi:hypothetical protein
MMPILYISAVALLSCLASFLAMSRILLKLAERSLPSMLLRDFQLFVKIPVMQLI